MRWPLLIISGTKTSEIRKPKKMVAKDFQKLSQNKAKKLLKNSSRKSLRKHGVAPQLT